VTGNLGYRVSVIPNLKLGATVVVNVVADRTPSPRDTTHGRQVRDQQGSRRKVPLSPQGPERRDHRRQPGLRDEASAEKGIEAIKTHAPNAKVEDHTEAKSG
jgi:hypothetical protein